MDVDLLFQMHDTPRRVSSTDDEATMDEPAAETSSFDIGEISYARPRVVEEE